jgi:hypothetical protein
VDVTSGFGASQTSMPRRVERPVVSFAVALARGRV